MIHSPHSATTPAVLRLVAALGVIVATLSLGLGPAAGATPTTGVLHPTSPSVLASSQSGQATMTTVGCATATRCVAIGADSTDQGVISYSGNGGASWSPIEVLDPSTILSLNSLACPSATTCVAVGASLEHTGIALVGTFRRGAWAWSTPTTMLDESAALNTPTVSFNSVTCPSVLECIAVGTDLTNSLDLVSVSTNGGATWSQDEVITRDGTITGGFLGELTAVSCLSVTTCLAVGSDPSGLPVVSYGSLSAGQWTWTAEVALPGDGQGGRFSDVSCFASTTCVAIGGDRINRGDVDVATWSGGTWTWRPETTVTPDGTGAGRLVTVTCSRTGVCEALGVDAASTSVVTRSTSAGSSWTVESPITGDGSHAPMSTNELTSVTCPNATSCVAVGTDSLVRGISSVSTTGGLTWSHETLFNVSALPGQGPLSYVSCVGQSCVAVGTNDRSQTVTARSTNGGTTWGPEHLVLSDSSGASFVQGVSCVASLCVLVGWDDLSRPVVARSLNDGVSWSAEQTVGADTSTEGFLYRVACPTTQRCVAVGWDGAGQAIVTHSFNGGATWTPETIVTHDASGSGFLYSVSCPRPSYCVAVGRDDQFKGVATYSSNGGVSWSPLQTLVSVTVGTGALDNVSCPSVALCVAVGGTGTGAGASVVARSVNGGRTWSPEAKVALDVTNFGLLTSVACPSASECVAGGSDGQEHAVTSYSFDAGRTWSRETIAIPGAREDFITSVACPNGVECVAVGSDGAQRGVTVSLRFATTVKFVSDGARGRMVPQSAYGTTRLHHVAFHRTGYRFVGWATSRHGRVVLHDRARFGFLSNVSLFAVWARR